jgi:endonuclease YncB( thermonuclease family)
MACGATVVSIGDGDTLRVKEGDRRVTIRLACIDAPETAQKPHGLAAREALKRLIPVGTQVSLRPQTTDRYGRTVAEVMRGSENVNLTLVRTGQAFVYEQYIARCDAMAYREAQSTAKGRQSGVWAVPGGITRPWDWRSARGTGGRLRSLETASPAEVRM